MTTPKRDNIGRSGRPRVPRFCPSPSGPEVCGADPSRSWGTRSKSYWLWLDLASVGAAIFHHSVEAQFLSIDVGVFVHSSYRTIIQGYSGSNSSPRSYAFEVQLCRCALQRRSRQKGLMHRGSVNCAGLRRTTEKEL